MTKTCKNVLITAILAICLLACLCSAVACVTPEDNSVTYTITVQTAADSPAKDVGVQICKGGVLLGNPKQTDANGKVEFQLAPDDYEVELSELPDGYHVKAAATLTENKRDITITLEKDFAYVVKLVDESGEPYYAQNVYVMICTLTGNCLMPVALPENGIAELIPLEGVYDYHVKVEGLPAHYSVGNVDADGYYTGELFSKDVTEMTITIYNITSVTSLTPMTDAQKNAYAQTNNSYKNNGQQYQSYQVSQSLEAGKVAYFSVTPTVSGKYWFYKNDALTYLTNDTEFLEGNSGNGLYNLLICEAGKTYFFKAVNHGTSKTNVSFVMTAPCSSYIPQSGQGAKLNLTIGKANTYAIISFTPTQAGTYNVEVDCKNAILNIYPNEPYEFFDEPADTEYATNPSKTFMAYASKLSNLYIAVAVKADSYPVEATVTVTKTANAVNTNTVAQVTETLTQYSKPAGQELVGVPMDGTATLVYNETDRFYHLGTADGPVVVVNITKPLEVSRFEAGATLAYMEMATQGKAQYAFVITQRPNGEDISNYSILLRGFDEYDKKQGNNGYDLVIPSEILTEVYYAKFVNEDGVYPLTKELETFLKEFVKANKEYVEWNVKASAENIWLFPCYYYADTTEADAIVGTYKFVSITEEQTTCNVGEVYNGYSPAVQSGLIDGKLTADTCVVQINKNNSLLIISYGYDSESETYNDGDMYDNGSWTKAEDGTYTFTCEYGTLTYANGTFTYVDSEAVIIFGTTTNA